MIQTYRGNEVFASLCSARQKWGMVFSILFHTESPGLNWDDEVVKLAPWLEDHHDLLMDQGGHILADTEEEILQLYNNTVGPDDRTGNISIYCLTCSPAGEFMNENT